MHTAEVPMLTGDRREDSGFGHPFKQTAGFLRPICGDFAAASLPGVALPFGHFLGL